MPRRMRFGPKRKSYGKGLRLNTKGGIPTSISAGAGGMRVNVSKRGTRVTTKNPITGKSMAVSGGGRRRRAAPRQATGSSPSSNRGCLGFLFPFGRRK